MVLKEWAKAAWSQPAGPGKVPGGVGHMEVEYVLGGAAHGVTEGNPGEHQRAWPPSVAHHRKARKATWRCTLTMGRGRMARVHPVEVLASCWSHSLHHVPRAATAVATHPPPTPARPGRRTKKRRR